MDERPARAERGVVREELRREVVRAVDDDVGRADERDRVPGVEAEVARVDGDRQGRAPGAAPPRGRLALRRVGLLEERLPVQVRGLDDVVLDDDERPTPPAASVSRAGPPRPPAPMTSAVLPERLIEDRVYPAPDGRQPGQPVSGSSSPLKSSRERGFRTRAPAPPAPRARATGASRSRRSAPRIASGTSPASRTAVSHATTRSPSSRRASSSVSRRRATRAAAGLGRARPRRSGRAAQSRSGSKNSATVTASPSAAAVTASVVAW